MTTFQVFIGGLVRLQNYGLKKGSNYKVIGCDTPKMDPKAHFLFQDGSGTINNTNQGIGYVSGNGNQITGYRAGGEGIFCIIQGQFLSI